MPRPIAVPLAVSLILRATPARLLRAQGAPQAATAVLLVGTRAALVETLTLLPDTLPGNSFPPNFEKTGCTREANAGIGYI